MKSQSTSITVRGIDIQVARKAIKNLYLRVHSMDGQVTLSVPLHTSNEFIHHLVLSRITWIEQQQAKVAAQTKNTPLKMISGESHPLWGTPHVLEVRERHGRHEILVEDPGSLTLYVRPKTATTQRIKVLNAFYRDQLRHHIPEMIEKWQPMIGRQVADWGIKKMRTRWGTCNTCQRRIWLNLELAKKSLQCLEYVVVHEMVHLLERHHNARFYAHMDRLLPEWRRLSHELNTETATPIEI